MAVHGPINSDGTAGLGSGWNYHCFICGAYGPHDCLPPYSWPSPIPPTWQNPSTTSTTTFNVQGWECPRCHSVFAPWVYKCDSCKPKENENAYPSPSNDANSSDPGNEPPAVSGDAHKP